MEVPWVSKSYKELREKGPPMAYVKLNPDSDDVGMKFKIIGISVPLAYMQSFLFDIFSIKVLPKSCL